MELMKPWVIFSCLSSQASSFTSPPPEPHSETQNFNQSLEDFLLSVVSGTLDMLFPFPEIFPHGMFPSWQSWGLLTSILALSLSQHGRVTFLSPLIIRCGCVYLFGYWNLHRRILNHSWADGEESVYKSLHFLCFCLGERGSRFGVSLQLVFEFNPQ